MPDPLRGAKVTIGGREHTIKFTHRALRVAQSRLQGRTMHELIPLDQIKVAAENRKAIDLGMNVVVELLGAGLLHEDPNSSDVSAEQILEADPEAYFRVNQALIMAWAEAAQRMVPQAVVDSINARKSKGGEGSAPPSVNAGGASVAGPTSDSSVSSAADTGSTTS